MCDVNKIATFLATACVLVLVAIGLCAAAAVAAGTFYGALANGLLMGAAAGSVGGALISISSAIVNVGPCVQGLCKGPAEILLNWLIVLRFGLSALVAALILGIIGTSIPWVGTASAIALGLGALTSSIALIVAQDNLGKLEVCLRGAASGLVTAVTVFMVVTAVALVVAAFAGGIFMGFSPGVWPPVPLGG